MVARKSTEDFGSVSRSSASNTTATTATPSTCQRMAQNYLLVWVDATIDQTSKDYQNMLTQIRAVVNDVTAGVKQVSQDSIPISFVTANEVVSSENLNQLEPNYMYTQIFKEILLEMEHDHKQAIKILAVYYRKFYHDNMAQLNIINEFEHNYRQEKAIWWYTRECLAYEMLNRALRTLDANTIINMGFFIHDLHQQIVQLHEQQLPNYRGKLLVVYRGQGLLKTDFDKLKKTKGGLMSFNSFLSTTNDQDVSFMFAESALGNPDMVGILFIMTIDPRVSSTPFASIKEVSYFKGDEKEILFSMHTVFRVGSIKQMDNNDRFYQIELQLTADDDKQLQRLAECISKEVVGTTGWQRLGELLLKTGHFNEAEELYKVLLEKPSSESEKTHYYHQLGYIKNRQGDNEQAIDYYEKALEIKTKTLPANHPSLAASYNNIGVVYDSMGEYLKALSFYEKALGIEEKTLPTNHPLLAICHGSIGGVYRNMGEYSKALSFYQKAAGIQEKVLPANHPDLAISYNNIGSVYVHMGVYSKALSFYEKALAIYIKTLPANHFLLATSYSNIGGVYREMEECSKSLPFLKKALEIREKTLPANHPSLATSYNNIGSVYIHIGECSKALSFLEKAVGIQEKTLPANHPLLAGSYNNIGFVYSNMREYSKALSFYEKAAGIQEKTLPANHPDLATSYNNIGGLYYNMEEYSKALSYFERVLNILKISVPSNHPHVKATIEAISRCLKEIRKIKIRKKKSRKINRKK
ncbi:unnamed protein product [Adineta steineri]|uniref:NAD(P)(+)--arginine ADP-ribosyltransferase n=1 Tax=Adineta steineri TaxID=433720 RepID=A0A815AVR9_9BILA|nr:unnamed protein product [Adineta steineri]